MTVVEIHIDELLDYVEPAFSGDDDLLFYYDKKANVKTTKEAAENVIIKIRKSYIGSECRGIKVNGDKVGFFVYADELLISFGLNKEYRNKVVLGEMWQMIKGELGDSFQCLLYSYNVRAIDWLRRNGMTVLFENTTLLRFENN